MPPASTSDPTETKPANTAESAVYDRYAGAAQAVEPALCCPVDYPRELLEAIPEEVLRKDYGCGDPSAYARPGETVLDLGSGGGKLCYMIAQVVGPEGRVIGVDCNTEMLALARRHRETVAKRIGYDNVSFRYGMIQDLRLDLDLLEGELGAAAVGDAAGWLSLRSTLERLRAERPMIADSSVDCVVSNCVLNLVRQQDRRLLFEEVFRVLKPGGRAAISDIVSDEDVPAELQEDPTLWSGCISGAFREDDFLRQFEKAGFQGIEIAKRQSEPWQTVRGIEFRSMTVVAHKGDPGPCLEKNQAVVYRGPFKQVHDDDGHTFPRGARVAVCEKTFRAMQRSPYEGRFEFIEPLESVDDPQPFDCGRKRLRDARETKGIDYDATTESLGGCGDGSCC